MEGQSHVLRGERKKEARREGITDGRWCAAEEGRGGAEAEEDGRGKDDDEDDDDERAEQRHPGTLSTSRKNSIEAASFCRV